MTSLGDVYGNTVGDDQSLRRLGLGTGLFAAGALLSVVAIVIATTGVARGAGLSTLGARHLAGVLGGVGVPAILLGVFTVLPTSNRIKAAAVIGASVCVLGVGLFWYAYPSHWAGYGDQLTFATVTVYFVGLLTATWCLFTAVVNFKTRNDPGGTVRMEVTREGERKVIEVSRERARELRGSTPDSDAQGGGVGLLGGTPDGDVETQTNDPGRNTAGRNGRARRGAASDGGATTETISSPTSEPPNPAHNHDASAEGDGRDAEVMESEPKPRKGAADTYCGNCAHFEYVRTDAGMQPYCGLHDEAMDDMEACSEWTPNN